MDKETSESGKLDRPKRLKSAKLDLPGGENGRSTEGTGKEELKGPEQTHLL